MIVPLAVVIPAQVLRLCLCLLPVTNPIYIVSYSRSPLNTNPVYLLLPTSSLLDNGDAAGWLAGWLAAPWLSETDPDSLEPRHLEIPTADGGNAAVIPRYSPI